MADEEFLREVLRDENGGILGGRKMCNRQTKQTPSQCRVIGGGSGLPIDGKLAGSTHF